MLNFNNQLKSYKYGFQGQEKQTETGWSSFKLPNSIPEPERFFNVDLLAEDYSTWSTYAFSGNRVVDVRELEGLEWSCYLSMDKEFLLFNMRI